MAKAQVVAATTSTVKGRERPQFLRALGRSEPPLIVAVDGVTYHRIDIFKHDSWAATACYRSADGRRVVCKFNRRAPIGIVPMRWLGNWLARREHYFLTTLAGVQGIPRVFDNVAINGCVVSSAVAHEFIPGNPLSLTHRLHSDFFDNVEKLLGTLHDKRIAYVDLHKQENVIVGDDGHPYLIDFQVSLQLPQGPVGATLFKMLQDCDLYHADKHRWIHRQPPASMKSRPRPWWLEMHRRVGVPLRTLRRRMLVLIGVRRGQGSSSTESAPEVGLRRADAA